MRESEPGVLRFALAPMSALFFWITVAVLPMPGLIALAGLAAPTVQWPLLGVAGFMATIYLLVWVWFRPTRFEIAADGLRIVWPLRQREFPIACIRGAQFVSRRQFRASAGWGFRVGAGGLWGGFGQLRTQREGRLAMYISRYDVFVRVQLDGHDDLLITPVRGPEFVHRLQECIAAQGPSSGTTGSVRSSHADSR